MTMIVMVNFLFGFFLLYPFMYSWISVSNIIEDLSDHVLAVHLKTSELFNLSKFEQTFNKKTIDQWDKIMNHIYKLIFVRATYIKYTFLFAWGSSKFISLSFGLFALFVNANLTSEIVQMIFLVLMLEIAVIRYLILPASLISSSLLRILNIALGYKRDIYEEICFPQQKKFSPEDLEYFKTCLLYFGSKLKYWKAQMDMGYFAYWFKIDSLHTWWSIRSGDLRNSILSLLFTLIPALLTYFVKNSKYA